ncbi:hypothetical protein RRG08_008811 [Elysia crispata]|uniref:YDG domain-containing protein n=1 Tax=Elysia crispata TaxID=231223 RepID=A0AAE0Z7K2_9GAST|nr:hypothetical protein RRG08_008811 [Elysia crispata]
MGPGEYESIRLKNLEDNKRVLAAFGLMNPFKPSRCIVKKSNRSLTKCSSTPKKRPLPKEDLLPTGSLYGTRRKSARLDGKEAGAGIDFGSTYEELDEAEKKTTRIPVDRPNFYGPIPGVEVGTEWATRMECSRDGIHRPTVAGIHGGQDGAYSIALSGGYEDDLDLGDCFTYTGEGGRDLKGTKAKPKNLRTAPQSKDQTLTRGNLALSRSVETKNPVRVIRGYKLSSQFAPEDGYRYDGIYTVEKFWFTTGLSGYGVWKFALKRCPDQAASPWQYLQDNSSATNGEESLSLPETVPHDRLKTELTGPDADPIENSYPGKGSKEQLDQGKSHSKVAPSTFDVCQAQVEQCKTSTAGDGSEVTEQEHLSADKQQCLMGSEPWAYLENNNNTKSSEKEASEPVKEESQSMKLPSDDDQLPPSEACEDSSSSNNKRDKAEG